MKQIDQKLTLPFEYPVIFTSHIFNAANPVLADAIDRLREHTIHRAMVFVDGNVARHYPRLAGAIPRYFDAHSQRMQLAAPPRLLPGGEACKNDFPLIENLAASMLAAHLSRHACVIAAGGGAVLDAVGFAASLVHRGLRLIRLPTTALSQEDGGVGVKNGVNFAGQKNALGVFAPPFAVISDFEFLRTLDDRAWRDGIAEAFKVAIIRDETFFDFLTQNAAELCKRDFAAMQQIVVRCAELHLEHIRIGGDPFEYGNARPLDFGHWSAHKLETLSHFKISHGEAVAAGILLDSLYAVQQGWLDRDEFERIRSGLDRSGLPVWFGELETRDDSGQLRIFEGLSEFQEHLGGDLCVTFPKKIGHRHEVHAIDLAAMSGAICELKKMAS